MAQSVQEIFTGAELFDRPKLSEVRTALRTKQFGALVCYAIDRLSRDIAHLAIIADECERHGVALLFVTEQLDSTPEGKLLQSVRGYVAEIERQKIRERTLRGRKSLAQAGKLHNGAPEKYGWRRDKENRVRIIYEPEAAIVRWIFQQVLEGHGIHSLAQELNERGVPPPSAGKYTYERPGTRWHGWTIRYILKHPAYAGESVGWTMSHRGERPPEEWLVLAAGTTPAIVTREEFERVQVRLRENKGAKKRNEKHFSLLRGMVVCECGCTMSPSHMRLGRKSYYTCNSRATRGQSCGAKLVRADALEAWVWQEVKGLLRNSNRLTKAIAAAETSGVRSALRADLKAAQSSADALRTQQARLVKSLRNLAATEAATLVEQELSRLTSELHGIESQVRWLEARIVAQKSPLLAADELLAFIQSVRVAENPTPAQRRTILEALQFKVKITRTQWTLIRGFEAGGDCKVEGVLPYTFQFTVACKALANKPCPRIP